MSFWENDPVVDTPSTPTKEGDWWKNDPVVDEPSAVASQPVVGDKKTPLTFTGELGAGHYLNALGIGLDKARNIGTEALSSISPELSAQVFGQTDESLRPEEISPPLISPELGRKIAGTLPIMAGIPPSTLTDPAARGMIESAGNALSSFSAPGALAQLPAFAIPGVAETYALNTLSELPDQGRRLLDTAQKYGWDSKETGKLAAEYGITDLTAFLAGKTGTAARYLEMSKALGAMPEPFRRWPERDAEIADFLTKSEVNPPVETKPVLTTQEVAKSGEVPSNVSSPSEVLPPAESRPDLARIDQLRQQSAQVPRNSPTDVPQVVESSGSQAPLSRSQPEITIPMEPEQAPSGIQDADVKAALEALKTQPGTEELYSGISIAKANLDAVKARIENASDADKPRLQAVQNEAEARLGRVINEVLGKNPEQAPSVLKPSDAGAPLISKEEAVVRPETPIADVNAENATGQNAPNPTSTGVANRVLEEEAKAGRFDPIEPGEGMSWQEMVDLGRQKMNEGADPQMIARRFQRNGRISAEDFAVIRAERERLAVETNKAEELVRANPSDVNARNIYNTARKTEADWVKNIVQPAKTKTSDIFRGMQGEAPIDATTFAGLRRAVLDEKGRELKPAEVPQVQRVADAVQRATRAEAAAREQLSNAVETMTKKRVPKTADELRAHFENRIRKATPC